MTSLDAHTPTDLAVIGLGYVGLPLALEASARGLAVVGIDASDRVVEGLNGGRSHVDDISDADVQRMLGDGFRATGDATELARARTIVVCVPTPLDEDGGPNISFLVSALDDIAEHVTADTLVVLESTTYPGTTERVARPKLEARGFEIGVDLFLAFSPERIDPGNPTWGLANTPKIVGGTTPACADRAVAFYGQFIDEVVRARGTREAETAKLLENTYRHVNIALVNEMAKFCHDLEIDFWDVIACASTKPFGFAPFSPGPGVGGHCIPIDPNYLSYAVRAELGYPFRFVELAQEINHGMPAYVCSRAQVALNSMGKAMKDASVLLVGVTYKADIADQRESPAEHVYRAMAALGARVSFHDPMIGDWQPVPGVALPNVVDPVAAAADADLVVFLQHHSSVPNAKIAEAAAHVLDTRGKLDRSASVELL